MSELPLNRWNRKAYQDFSGGLATRPDPLSLPGTKFAQLDNVILADHDLLEKAPGYSLDGSPFPNATDSFIRFLINFRVGTSVNSLVVAAQDDTNTNATYKVDFKQTNGDGNYHYIGYTVGTAVFTSGSPTVAGTNTLFSKNLKAGDKIGTGANPSVWYEVLSITTDTNLTLTTNYVGTTTASTSYMARVILNLNNTPAGTVFNNNLIIVNGVDAPMQFDNSSMNRLQDADVPIAFFVENHKSRVFMARTSANPSGLYWSASNDQTSWDAGSFAPIYENDNGNIVAIRSFANSLLVFKDNGSVYQVVGEFDQDLVGQPTIIRRLDCPDNIGIIAGKTVIRNDDNKLYFMAETGVYTVDPRMYIEKVSWDIAPTVSNLVISSNPVANKNYPFTTQAQWNTGSMSGFNTTRVTNGLSTYFDKLSITDAQKANNGVATAIDANGDIHIAYVSTDGKTINHTLYKASDLTTTKTAVQDVTAYFSDTTARANSVSIAIAPNGNIGILTRCLYLVGHTQMQSQNIADPVYPGVQYSEVGSGPPYTTCIAIDLSSATGACAYLFSEFDTSSWHTTTAYAAPSTDLVSNLLGTWQRSDGTIVYSDGVSLPYGTYFISKSHVADSSGISLVYRTDNTIRAAVSNKDSSGGHLYIKGTSGSIVGGVWSAGTWSSIALSGDAPSTSLVLDGSDHVFIGACVRTATLRYLTSTNDGSSFTTVDVAVSGASDVGAVGAVQIGLNGSGGGVITYDFIPGSGKLLRYDSTTTLTTTLDSGSDNVLKGYNRIGEANYTFQSKAGSEKVVFETLYTAGTATLTNGSTDVTGSVAAKWATWVVPGDVIKATSAGEDKYATVLTVNSDSSITLTSAYTGVTSTTAAYIIKHTNAVTNSAANPYSDAYRMGDKAVVNNGSVFALVGCGVNANEIVIRRMSLYSLWTGPVESDTINAWGAFAVSGQQGSTLTYDIGLSTNSTMASYAPITSGSIISTNTSLNFSQPRITAIFSSYAQISLTSLILNYSGTGIDAKSPSAFVFNNELYIAAASVGASNDNTVLFLDRNHAWINNSLSVTCFARMNQTLYAGSATNGNVYKMRQNYTQNGAAYTMTAVTKEDLLGSLELTKEIEKVYVIYKIQNAGSFTFSYRLDSFKNPSAVWVDTVIDQTSGGLYEVPVNNVATSIQFKIAQADSGVTVAIAGFVIVYAYLNIR